MSRYAVYITPQALYEIKDLPGHMRQRIKRAVRALAEEPRPSGSHALVLSDSRYELRRLRLDRWRLVYAITEEAGLVDVLAVRKRPPYDYGDLDHLLRNLA